MIGSKGTIFHSIQLKYSFPDDSEILQPVFIESFGTQPPDGKKSQ